MPLIKSAIKRAKQNPVRRARRQPVKTYMKTMLKKMADLTTAGKRAEAVAILPETYSAIDMAAKQNIIHPRNAARKKSLVARLVAAQAK